MKVYIVTAFDAEPYSDGNWIDSVWESKEKAELYVSENKGILGPKDGGYLLSSYIQPKEVQ